MPMTVYNQIRTIGLSYKAIVVLLNALPIRIPEGGVPMSGKSKTANRKIHRSDHHVLRKLGAGGRLSKMGDGWRIGSSVVREEVVTRLQVADLVISEAPAADGQVVLRLSEPGRAYLARIGAGQDGAYVQNRLLTPSVLRRVDGDEPVTRNLAVNPLAWLLRRRLIDQRQFDAAERLRGDFEMAQLSPRITMAWDASPPARNRRAAPGAPDPTASQISAKRRVATALETLGPGLQDVAWRVVCADEGLETAEKAMGWPARSAKLVLGLALDRLADHFRIK